MTKELTDVTQFIIASFFVLGILAMFIGLIGFMEEKKGETSCYDRYNNRIIGQTCYEDTIVMNETGQIISIIGFGMILLFGFFLFTRSLKNYSDGKYINMFGFEKKRETLY